MNYTKIADHSAIGIQSGSLYSFVDGQTSVNIVKKLLSGGGRGESEITNRSLIARFINVKYNHSMLKSSIKIKFFSSFFGPFSQYHQRRAEQHWY